MSLKRFDVSSIAKNIKTRRALLYSPSMEIKKLTKAASLKNLDTLSFDLEDGVPQPLKSRGRENIKAFLHDKNSKVIPELALRINSIDSEDSMLDLNEIMLDKVCSDRIQTVIIPKVEDPEEVRFVSRWLRLNKINHAKILAMIETPVGLTRVVDICRSSPRLDGVIFGAEDYRSASGILRGSLEPIQYARSAIVAAARAAHIQCIDMTSVNFRDKDIVTKEAIESRNFGFTGRQVIHPMQIDCVNKAFMPSDKEAEQLEKLIKSFVKTTCVDGKGVVGDNGQMIELPHIADAINKLLVYGKSIEEIQKIADSVFN